MSVPCKFECSLLSHEEYEAIRLTHHPAIYDVEVVELEAIDHRGDVVLSDRKQPQRRVAHELDHDAA